jgi:hypothetical protein
LALANQATVLATNEMPGLPAGRQAEAPGHGGQAGDTFELTACDATARFAGEISGLGHEEFPLITNKMPG